MIRYMSWCAGVEGFGQGLDRAGFTRAGACEIDPSARRIYAARFGHEPMFGDMYDVKPEEIPASDLWCAGTPCHERGRVDRPAATQHDSARRGRARGRSRPPAPREGRIVSRFAVLLADPPWRYSFSRSDSRKVENQYPTMTVEEICALPIIRDVVAEDAILLLWATAPKLLEALRVMEAWGFRYVTQRIWDKQRVGMGYWTRGRHELLLIGVRGKPKPPEPKHRRPSVFVEKRSQKHSEKPTEPQEWAEAAWPDAPKIELFARRAREGWAAFGNEVGHVMGLAWSEPFAPPPRSPRAGRGRARPVKTLFDGGRS